MVEGYSAKQHLFPVIAVLILCFVMPFGSLPIRSLGGAALFSVCLGFFPDTMRSRNGSMKPAIGLLAFVWLCAAVVVVMSVLGLAK